MYICKYIALKILDVFVSFAIGKKLKFKNKLIHVTLYAWFPLPTEQSLFFFKICVFDVLMLSLLYMQLLFC